MFSKMQSYGDVRRYGDVVRGTSDVLKAGTVHVERLQRDLSQIFIRPRFVSAQGEKPQRHVRMMYTFILIKTIVVFTISVFDSILLKPNEKRNTKRTNLPRKYFSSHIQLS